MGLMEIGRPKEFMSKKRKHEDQDAGFFVLLFFFFFVFLCIFFFFFGGVFVTGRGLFIISVLLPVEVSLVAEHEL